MKMVTKETAYYFDNAPDGLDDFFIRIAQYPLLCYEQEKILAERIAGGDPEAVNTLVEHNLRLVVYVAKRYAKFGVALEDMIGDGIFGLFRAAQKYDGRNRFSSYATWWIVQSIMRNLDAHYEQIYMPAHAHDSFRKMKRIILEQEMTTGNTPTVEELASLLKKTPEDVRHLQTLDFQFYSLDRPVDPDKPESGEWSEFICDENAIDPANRVEQLADTWLVQEALSHLPKREADVLRRRYGIAPYEHAQTLKEIQQDMDLSRERIRQLEVKAMKTLKRYLLSRKEYAA